MRIIDIISESITTRLSTTDLIKHGPERLMTLTHMISNNIPLYTVDGTPVEIQPSEADRILDLYNKNQFSGRITLAGKDGRPYPLTSFLKTKEFGGLSVPPTQAGEEPDENNLPVSQLKAGPTFAHGDVPKGQELTAKLAVDLGAFHASQLGKHIIANEFLDTQGRAGAAVKQIAAEIDAGKVPTIPNLTKTELSNIQNYAFEYLGVQQLIKGTADFPNADAFYNHVGVNLSNLVLYFPKSSGNPLTDSYALVNKATRNSIGISSKGAKGGAPSSIQGLKIPDRMLKMAGQDPAITFLDLIQQAPPMLQPFVAVNWIHENYPGNLGKLEKFLPFDDTFFNWIEFTWKNQTQGVPNTLEDIPKPYQRLYSLVQSSIAKTVDNPLFYDLRYYVKDVLHDAVRRNCIPHFNARMLEILGENFIVLKTERVGKPGVGQFITRVHWPSKVGGTVTFEHKDPAPKWTSAITWKLS
jgi:hypothetical protein